MSRITFEQIPSISVEIQDAVLDLALPVMANGQPARVFLSKREHLEFHGDDMIVIVWDLPNEEYGESFTTKYFMMKEPGVLTWGHDNGEIILEAID